MFICKNIYNLTIAVFRWEENMTQLFFISLSYDTKIVKIFIYFIIEMIFLDLKIFCIEKMSNIKLMCHLKVSLILQ